MVVVLVLTRKCHQDGVWITRLTEALRAARTTTSFRILAVEDLLQFATDPARLLLCELEQFQEHAVLVNRVSDAADPATVKFTVSLLQVAKLFGITVWNGPTSYSLCVSKWCHHVILDRAGLQSPATRVMSSVVTEPWTTNEAALLPPFPLLIKPNAGGFGRGIQRVENMSELQDAFVKTTKQGDTDIMEPVLLQTYMEPKDQLIYRVWFLKGRVQCAVTRKVQTTTARSSQDDDGAANEFTSGCTAGGVCSRGGRPTSTTTTTTCSRGSSSDAFRAWKVPYEVADEVQRIVQVLPDANTGSVEFLYGRDDNQRYYFDVNLLSTLPLPETISNRDEVWSPDYDPWTELAAAIVASESN